MSDSLRQSMEFSRPEYWGGQPFPSPGDLPNPGIEPRSPALLVDSLPAEPQGKQKIGFNPSPVLWLNSSEKCILFSRLFLYFIFNCAGSSLVHVSFLQWQRAGAPLQSRPLTSSLWWRLLLQHAGSRVWGFRS